MDYSCNFREAVWCGALSFMELEAGPALFGAASPADLSPSTCFQ